MTAIPVSGTANTMPVVFSDMNITSSCNAGGLTLTSANGVSTTVVADGSGNLKWGASVDSTVYKSFTFSKPDLEEKIKQFRAGKYTRKFVEVYLEFMVMNAMLDNLEYLEYKVALDKELSQ